MKRILPAFVAISTVLLVHSAFAYEHWLGTITSPDGGAFNNTTSAVTLSDAGTGSRAFVIGYGLKLAVQCDSASCLVASADAGFVATCSEASTSHGEVLQAGQLFDIPTDSSVNVVSMVPVVAGASNCDVFQVLP